MSFISFLRKSSGIIQNNTPYSAPQLQLFPLFEQDISLFYKYYQTSPDRINDTIMEN